MRNPTKAKHYLLDNFETLFEEVFDSEYHEEHDFIWEVHEFLEENTEPSSVAENWDDEDLQVEFIEDGFTRDGIIYETMEDVFEDHDLIDEFFYEKATQLVSTHLQEEDDSNLIDTFVEYLKKIYFA